MRYQKIEMQNAPETESKTIFKSKNYEIDLSTNVELVPIST